MICSSPYLPLFMLPPLSSEIVSDFGLEFGEQVRGTGLRFRPGTVKAIAFSLESR
jgi:hypothetical protein